MGSQDAHTGGLPPGSQLVGTGLGYYLRMLIAYVPHGLSLPVAYARSISWCSGRKSELNGKLIVIY